jgi:hypothetical protein
LPPRALETIDHGADDGARRIPCGEVFVDKLVNAGGTDGAADESVRFADGFRQIGRGVEFQRRHGNVLLGRRMTPPQ